MESIARVDHPLLDRTQSYEDRRENLKRDFFVP